MSDDQTRGPVDCAGSEETLIESFDVQVRRVGGSGNDVDCDISAAGKSDDNAIFLNLNQPYEVTFRLQGNPGFGFHRTNPFGTNRGKCPPASATAHAPFRVTAFPSNANPHTFTVAVTPVTGRAVTYYRLNFDNGTSCDPIIIHD